MDKKKNFKGQGSKSKEVKKNRAAMLKRANAISKEFIEKRGAALQSITTSGSGIIILNIPPNHTVVKEFSQSAMAGQGNQSPRTLVVGDDLEQKDVDDPEEERMKKLFSNLDEWAVEHNISPMALEELKKLIIEYIGEMI